MRTLFIGTGDIGVPALQSLLNHPDIELAGIVTQPDRPAGRRRDLKPSAIKAAAPDSTPILQPEKLRHPDAVEAVRALAPELAVCMAYGQILPASLLDIPPKGCLNLHASLLPRHRGAAPIQAAIAAGDRETGITVMRMDTGLDTGDVLLQESIVIGEQETAGELHDRLADVAAQALRQALPLIASGTAAWQPQEEARATYAPKLSAEAAQLDWRQGAVELERWIRAMLPWPGAWSLLELESGAIKKVKLHQATPLETSANIPGRIEAVGPDGLVVGCGEGSLQIEWLQMEGRKLLPVRDFLNGVAVPIGARFLPLETIDS